MIEFQDEYMWLAVMFSGMKSRWNTIQARTPQHVVASWSRMNSCLRSSMFEKEKEGRYTDKTLDSDSAIIQLSMSLYSSLRLSHISQLHVWQKTLQWVQLSRNSSLLSLPILSHKILQLSLFAFHQSLQHCLFLCSQHPKSSIRLHLF